MFLFALRDGVTPRGEIASVMDNFDPRKNTKLKLATRDATTLGVCYFPMQINVHCVTAPGNKPLTQKLIIAVLKSIPHIPKQF